MDSKLIISLLHTTLQLPNWKIENTISLLQEGATVPFIARYRKERTGNLDEVAIEDIQKETQRLKELSKRKATILKSINEQGKLTDALQEQINKSWDEVVVEDLYLPYKSKRKTRADIAIENGLEPLAKMILAQQSLEIGAVAKRFINSKVKTVSDAISGASDIAAQWISERVYLRENLRRLYRQEAVVVAKVVKSKKEDAEKFKDYFDFSESLKRIKSHRFLAVMRGQNLGLLKVKVVPDQEVALQMIYKSVSKNNATNELLQNIVADAYKRLLRPSIEKEITKEFKLKADIAAINVFGKNLKQLLLESPIGGLRTLAIDPGYRTGCKVVCLDANGDLLHNSTIFPNPPQKEVGMAKKKIATLVEQYKINAIAIGNGTASRETERFVKGTHFDREVRVFIVNEAGASIYSASKIAREEFPQQDVTVRGAISIGRRLMDPLSELVKIDPKSIGVGQYQYDVDQKLLSDSLDTVVVSCVNQVGINLNTASKYLLTYVSGIGETIAENIIAYRSSIGAFESRKQLLQVPKLGAKVYEQCAGFLRVENEKNPLDNSRIHPERYALVNRIAKSQKTTVAELIGNEIVLNGIQLEVFATEDVGLETLQDIILELKKPGRDPRRMAKVFEFDKSLRSIDDLKTGATIPGIVNNVTNFGAFVDIGIKENGLIHISNLADEFVSDPSELITLHQHVMVEVISVDAGRKRIGLKLLADS